MGVSGEFKCERTKGQQNKRGGVDVLSYMFVTAAVSHLEMSALNADAWLNAVEVLSMPWSQSKNNKWKKNEEKRMGEKREVDEGHKEWKNQRNGVDVLCRMFVTAAVFQVERSPLNADAW